ncbi:hypothetical protein BH11PLA1_BH11PLA1_19220 [soil metagenome]
MIAVAAVLTGGGCRHEPEGAAPALAGSEAVAGSETDAARRARAAKVCTGFEIGPQPWDQRMAQMTPVAARDSASAAEPALRGARQLTAPEMFLRAGEAYFDHASPPRRIVFQAIPRPKEGDSPDSGYSMFVATLVRDGAGAVTGIGSSVRVSLPGSHNTCAWFDPQDSDRLVFATTITAPAPSDAPGYSKDRGRYSWQFPAEMDVHSISLASVNAKAAAGSALSPGDYTRLIASPGYDAEGSLSPDGRYYLYTHVEPGARDPDIKMLDLKTRQTFPMVVAPGYDGGPFFHPDWPRTPLICYRSDRKGDNNLQVYVAEVKLDAEGLPQGLTAEVKITDDDGVVNWAPFWTRDGKGLVFTSSLVGHDNYEVFRIGVDWERLRDANARDDKASTTLAPAARKIQNESIDAAINALADARARRVRITNAAGFDGLPAFSDDGTLMMWTSQRGGTIAGEARPSSQLWIAKYDANAEMPHYVTAPPPASTPQPENRQ